MNADVTKVLQEARDFMSRRKWTDSALALDINGRVADTWSAPEQIASCSHFGAIHIVMSSTDVAKHLLRDAASARLRAAIGTTEVCCHRAALKAFDRAIGEEVK